MAPPFLQEDKADSLATRCARDVYRRGVPTQVIVLNSGSSSGKSSIARCRQSMLPEPWLTLGVDTLIQAMPRSMQGSGWGIQFAPDGQVLVGGGFRRFEAAWYRGFAAVAGADTGVIVDEVFLGGAASQHRLRVALDGLEVLWVGVRCDGAVAADREAARGDRTGMAESQADLVHNGVLYDLEVDTTTTTAIDCARAIADHT
jgi:chloramphenicol 3-O phosphotransferase